MRQPFPAILLIALALCGARAAEPGQIEFFEKHVRPVLVEQCYKCHGPEKQMAELRLDSREAVLKGSDVGPVVEPGKPEKSSLITSIRHEGESKMPEKADKLPEEQIAALSEWVRMGMPWPEGEAPKTAQQDAAKNHWAFQQVKKPSVPEVQDAQDWVQSPVDRFILAQLEEKGIAPSPLAARRTLVRRATFDLTGLPPTMEEIETFENDSAPDAFARVVDRLLASPRYGERWGRYWLDVARYADTKGYVFQEERRYPYSYTYRDWVVKALNDDLPYDQFLIQQIAADHVAGEDKRPLAAMGFLTLGRRFLNAQPDIIDDRIDVISRGTMALTVTCARCHDHKFDPISQKDYYALYGVFASSIEPQELPQIGDHEDEKAAEEYRKELAKRQAKVDEAVAKKCLEESLHSTVASGAPVILPPLPRDALRGLLSRLDRDRIRDLQKKVDQVNASPISPPRAMALLDAPNPVQPRVFKRGNPNMPGDEVPRRFISVLAGGDPQPFKKGSGRLELAEAIASASNPLTARVMVNRVWMHHFGAGLVRTPGDFGVKGEPPTHPELLDWLAARFVEDGWSLKKLHRLIMLTSAYQQSSDVREDLATSDPENRLLARSNRRRLDFEATRDSLLKVSGKLDLKMGGRAVELTSQPFNGRRSIYGFIDRQNLPGMFRTFDFASPDTTNPQRYNTTVPQQALFMLNSPFVIEQARALAGKAAATGAVEEAVQRLYAEVFSRRAEPGEVEAAVRFISAQQGRADEPREEVRIWSYGHGHFDEGSKKVSFTELPVFSDQTWKGEKTLPAKELGWVSLHARGGHPGRDRVAAIRRWTAPADAEIAISGKLERPHAEGDGVHARIVSSRSGELLKVSAAPKESVETKVERLEVKRGDTIDFILEAGASESFDMFNWAPLLVAEGSSWNAEEQFAGPPAARKPPLTAWEKYAQVLLASNEFVFVD